MSKSGYEIKFKGKFFVEADSGDLASMIAAKKAVDAIKEAFPEEVEITDWTEKHVKRRAE